MTTVEQVISELNALAKRDANLRPRITLRAIIQLLLGKRAQF